MKKVVVNALILALAIGASGCGEKKDDNVSIIGGADGPTSIYLAPSSDEEEFRYADPIDGDLYYEVMDRILVEYGFDGQEWGTSIDLKGETDAVISLAMDSTGRYKALGIISKEAGCYGIILDEFSAGMYKMQVETEGGEKYTLQTPEGDMDVLVYYETWNDDEFPDAYRGGSSLTRCN